MDASPRYHVWVRRLDGRPQNVAMDTFCVARINADSATQIWGNWGEFVWYSSFWDYGAILEVQCGSSVAISVVGVNYNVSNGQDSGRKVILFGNFVFVGLRMNSGIMVLV